VMIIGYVNFEAGIPCRRVGGCQQRRCGRHGRQIRRGTTMQTRRWGVCKRNGGVQIQSTEKLFDVLRSKVISRQSITIKIMVGIHVIVGDRTRLFSAVPDSPNAFLIIGPEEIDGTKNIFVPFGGLKGEAASIVRLRPNPFSFSALRERVDGLLPGRFGRVGLRGPYR
jgi:hypothetical protein